LWERPGRTARRFAAPGQTLSENDVIDRLRPARGTKVKNGVTDQAHFDWELDRAAVTRKESLNPRELREL